MFRKILRLAVLALSLAASATLAKDIGMVVAADQNPKPQSDKAMVVFLRPSFYGGRILSSLYDAPDGGTTFLGILQSKYKLAVEMAPGKHRLMVVSENADFLDAELEAGKIYYVLVSPRPGALQVRFSLLPTHNASDAEHNVESKDFKEWVEKTIYVQLPPEHLAWYEKNRSVIERKKIDYLEKWNRMLPQDRAVLTLHAEDGVASSP